MSLLAIKLIVTPLVRARGLARRQALGRRGRRLAGRPAADVRPGVGLPRHRAGPVVRGSGRRRIDRGRRVAGRLLSRLRRAGAPGRDGCARRRNPRLRRSRRRRWSTAGLSTALLFAAALAALALVLWLLPRRLIAVSAASAGWWDMPLRIGVTTALVVGLTSAATTLGPEASGAAASFPLIGASIAAFAHWRQGPEAGVAVMRGMASALYAFAVFFAIAGAAPAAHVAAWRLSHWRRPAASSPRGRRCVSCAARQKWKTRPRGNRPRLHLAEADASGLLGSAAFALTPVMMHPLHGEARALRHQHVAPKHGELLLLRLVEAVVQAAWRRRRSS